MVRRSQSLPGMGMYAARLRRASRQLLDLRNKDAGIGSLANSPSTLPDTAGLLFVASMAEEAWSDVQPTVEYLASKALDLGSAIDEGRNAPTEWLSSVIRGLTCFQQVISLGPARSGLTTLATQLVECRIDGGWAETLRGPEVSITQTARTIVALTSLLERAQTAQDFGLPWFDEPTVVGVREAVASGVQCLLDQRENSGGWRLRANSTGNLSYAATAECLLAIDAADAQPTVQERAETVKNYQVGAANVAPSVTLPLTSVVYESAWWLTKNHSIWVASVESDPESAIEPWSRLSYATALEAALLGGQNPSGLALSAKHLDSLWLDEKGIWGEWDGNISMPTTRGTVSAVRAYDALRAALVRQATEGFVELPSGYEPLGASTTLGSLSVEARAKKVELVYQGERYELVRPDDEIAVLAAIVDAGAFGATYESIEMATRVPTSHLNTYIGRINQAARAATIFRLDALLVRMPGRKPARWRLAPYISRAEASVGEVAG